MSKKNERPSILHDDGTLLIYYELTEEQMSKIDAKFSANNLTPFDMDIIVGSGEWSWLDYPYPIDEKIHGKPILLPREDPPTLGG